MAMQNSQMKLAILIPAYRVSKHILNVISSIGREVDLIYVIDDCLKIQETLSLDTAWINV